MQLFFWQNIVSPHQAPFMRELADLGHDVTVVAAEFMSEERRLLGWECPSLGAARLIVNPDDTQISHIIEDSCTDSIHLIAGVRGTPLGKHVALACARAKRRMGLITEAPDSRGIGGILRWLKYSWERLTTGRKFDFILTMGEKGVEWFSCCGYPLAVIFPFVYVTDSQANVGSSNEDRPFQVLFVGRLVPLKRVDLLLRAFQQIAGAELAIVGDGPEEKKLRKLAISLGLSDSIDWLGQLDAQQVQSQMAQADLLVLPSFHDGWGAVINEALMVGTPVICSSACGGSELIGESWRGTVFRAQDVTSLSTSITSWREKGHVTRGQREKIIDWCRKISGLSVAVYIERVLMHTYNSGDRPDAPWRT